jgi:glycosyltransferase involved in cell wall biosynthesis/organic radical activating enzyme
MSSEKNRKIQYMKNILDPISKTACAAKWYNATIRLDMGVTTSCHHPEFHPIDLIEVQKNPKAIHNTKEKKEQREKMLAGKKPAGCEYCWKLEDLGEDFVSDRFYKSKIYTDQEVSEISNLGSETDIDLKTLEVSFDKNCNFACSYCTASFSSRWSREMKTKGLYKNLKHDVSKSFNHDASDDLYWRNEEDNPVLQAFWNWWPKLSESLQELRITGGEPLLSQQFWKLIDKLKQEKPEMDFAVNSNLGASDDLIDKLIDASKEIENFDLYTSCESIDSQAEYIRDGLDYEKFKINIEKLITNGNFRSIHIMMTINSLCLFGLIEFLDQIYIWKKKTDKLFTFTLNILSFPSFMSPLILPVEIREKCARELEQWLESKKTTHECLYHEIEAVKRLVEYLISGPAPFNNENEKKCLESDFKNFFIQYDQRRNKSFYKTFPQELINWFNEINGEDINIISVIIPTLYPKGNLDKLIDSIANSAEAKEQIQLICVNNYKKYSKLPFTKKWKNKFLDFKYITSEIAGANSARNLGIRYAQGEIIVFIDDDCIIDDDYYFQKIISDHNSRKNISGIGGLYTASGNMSAAGKAYFKIADHWLQKSIYNEEEQLTRSLIGGNCSYKSEIFNEGFNFDPRVTYGGTEVSLNHALFTFGKKLSLNKNIKNQHYLKINIFNFMKKAFLQGRGKAHNEDNLDLIKSNNLQKLEKGFYFNLYDVFFNLGLENNKKSDLKIVKFFKSIVYSPPIKSYLWKIRHFSTIIFNFIFYKVLMRPVYKLFFMSKYHYETYLIPCLNYFRSNKDK